MKLGNPLDWIAKVKSFHARNAASIAFTEAIGIGLSLGSMWGSYKLFPNFMEKVERGIDKMIEPRFDKLNNVIEKTGYVHNLDEEVGEQPTRQGKVRAITKSILDIGIGGLVGFPAGYFAHKHFDKRLGLGNKSSTIQMSRVADYGVQIGVFTLINTVAAKHSNELAGVCAKLLVKLGVDEQKAKRSAAYLTRYEVPNIIGAVSGWAYMVARGTHGVPAGK